MNQGSKRIFWSAEERELLATRMAQILLTAPGKSKIAAVKEAQLALPEDRRREIIAWSVVETALLPLLLKAMSSATSPASAENNDSLPQAPVAETPSTPPAEAPEGVQFEQQITVPPAETVAPSSAPQALPNQPSPTAPVPIQAAVPVLDPLATEAAVLVALGSPVVRRALEALFSETLASAIAKLQPGAAAAENIPEAVVYKGGEGRVLLAGFAKSQMKSLEKALEGAFEVRTWSPAQGNAVFSSLGGICPITVVPEEMPEEVDDFLKPSGTRVVRFQGSASRLQEQLAELFK